MTKFSLIVPYHNSQDLDRSAMMDELIASLPDRNDLELLLIDDHSVAPYQPKRRFEHTQLRLLANRDSWRFAGTARNLGIEQSSGDFLFFGDSDDRFDTQALGRVMDGILSDPEYGLVLARATSFLEDGSRGNRHDYMDGIYAEISNGNTDALVRLHSPVSKFIRRSFIEKTGLRYGDTRVANDVLFNVKMAANVTRLKLSNEIIYHIRQGNSSLTNDPRPEAARTRIRVAREAQAILVAAGRKDLRQPMAYTFLRFFKAHPRVVLLEMLVSILRRDRIVSSKRRALRRILRLA